MARIEQDIQRPIQELPKGEVVFQKQLTLGELLQIKPGEEGETKNLLNNVPFDFEVRDIGKSLLHIASFSERQPVGLQELFSLLQAAKSGGVSRGSQSINDILFDWRIILPEVRGKESRSKELYDFHKEHVPGFTEFEENDFELFWKVLDSGNKKGGEAALFIKRFFIQQLSEVIDEREFFVKYGRQRDFSNNQVIQCISSLYRESFKQFLEEKGFSIPPTDPKEPDFFLKSGRLSYWLMGEQERRSLEIEFYKKSVVDEGRIDVERNLGRLLRWSEEGAIKTTLIGEGGELNRIDTGGVLKPLDVVIREKLSVVVADDFTYEADDFKRFENGHIELTKGKFFIRISIVEGEDGYKKPKLEDCHLSIEEMVPLIIWQTDKQTGERSYYCGRLNELPRHNTLLGQLVVAAYSPKVRDQMPEEYVMKDKDGKKITQKMREAQSVLLVPMFAQKFLEESPVIASLEALSKQKA